MAISKAWVIVKFKETAMLIFREIQGMHYWIDKDEKEEWVHVDACEFYKDVYGKECKKNFESFEIRVTDDSPAAMIDDVWKELKRRFC